MNLKKMKTTVGIMALSTMLLIPVAPQAAAVKAQSGTYGDASASLAVRALSMIKFSPSVGHLDKKACCGEILLDAGVVKGTQNIFCRLKWSANHKDVIIRDIGADMIPVQYKRICIGPKAFKYFTKNNKPLKITIVAENGLKKTISIPLRTDLYWDREADKFVYKKKGQKIPKSWMPVWETPHYYN